jgi:hypothetical protein
VRLRPLGHAVLATAIIGAAQALEPDPLAGGKLREVRPPIIEWNHRSTAHW